MVGHVRVYGLTDENTDLPVAAEVATNVLEYDVVSSSSERFENSIENEATFSPPQIASLNINSVITNTIIIKARKLLKDKLMLQDTRINSKERWVLTYP